MHPQQGYGTENRNIVQQKGSGGQNERVIHARKHQNTDIQHRLHHGKALL